VNPSTSPDHDKLEKGDVREHVLTFDDNGNIPVWDDLARNALKKILGDDMETIECEEVRRPRPISINGEKIDPDDVPCG